VASDFHLHIKIDEGNRGPTALPDVKVENTSKTVNAWSGEEVTGITLKKDIV